MSKTKEELNELKKEVEAVNEKLQELTPEEIAQVSGVSSLSFYDYNEKPFSLRCRGRHFRVIDGTHSPSCEPETYGITDKIIDMSAFQNPEILRNRKIFSPLFSSSPKFSRNSHASNQLAVRRSLTRILLRNIFKALFLARRTHSGVTPSNFAIS